MSGWDDQLDAAPPPPPPAPKQPKRKKKKRASTDGSAPDVEDQEDEEEQQPEDTAPTKTPAEVGEELSEKLNKVSQKFISLQKSAAVIGSGKPYQQDNNDVRKKIMTKLENLKSEVRDTAKNQRSVMTHTTLDKKFRDNLEHGIKQLDTDLKAFIVELRKRTTEFPPPPKPQQPDTPPPAEEVVDPLDQLEITMDGDDVEAELTQEKNEGLLELEESFDAVSDVINDLAVMVHEQGELIEKIETNVSTAKENVHEGVQSLAEAKKYQAEARKKMCIMASGVLLAILGGVVGLILYLKMSPASAVGMEEMQLQRPSALLSTTDIQVPPRWKGATASADVPENRHRARRKRPGDGTLELLESSMLKEYEMAAHKDRDYSARGLFRRALSKMNLGRPQEKARHDLQLSLEADIAS
jgi:hypothetical protein